jgi:hypothetical protein
MIKTHTLSDPQIRFLDQLLIDFPVSTPSDILKDRFTNMQDFIRNLFGGHDFDQNPLLKIENIPSKDYYKMIHCVLTGLDPFMEHPLRILDRSAVVSSSQGDSDKSFHQDGGEITSLLCLQGGGIVSTDFLDHKRWFEELPEFSKEILRDQEHWNPYTGTIGAIFFSLDDLSDELNTLRNSAYTNAYHVRITLGNDEAIIYNDKNILHRRAGDFDHLEEERILLRLSTLNSFSH